MHKVGWLDGGRERWAGAAMWGCGGLWGDGGAVGVSGCTVGLVLRDSPWGPAHSGARSSHRLVSQPHLEETHNQANGCIQD